MSETGNGNGNENTIVVANPAERITAVRSLLQPMRPLHGEERTPVAADIVATPRNAEIVVAAFEKKSALPFRDWLFRTRSRSVWAHYAEYWRQTNTSKWCMHQAMLHLYLARSPKIRHEELIGLHCEPHVTEDSIKSKIKRGLHIHITADDNQLAHAHIPLNYRELDAVLDSMRSLDEAISSAIEIVCIEVVDRVE